MKKLFFLALMCFMTLSISAQYVDLGLPSGTLWKNANENGFYNYENAIIRFGNNMPTKWQWAELKGYCTWRWTGQGYKIIGPNDNSIYLPAVGWHNWDGDIIEVGTNGSYWSSTPYDAPNFTWCLYFSPNMVQISNSGNEYGLSVRLVQNP